MDAPRRLFHVSEEAGIARFEPRAAHDQNPLRLDRPVVWAVAEPLLHNYLLPRDCPRVTFYARPNSDPADVALFFAHTAARYVVAIESGWLARAQTARLYLYEFEPAGFEVVDEGAGYYVSGQPVTPLAVHEVTEPLWEMVRRDVELRVTPSLWPLRDAVLASSLQFSFIRVRIARPRG